MAGLSVRTFVQDASRVSIPRPEVHLVARIGGSARDGLDLHVLGPREVVHRKFIRGGQCVAMARLRIEASLGVLGISAAEVVGRAVPLEDVWGRAASKALHERVAEAGDMPGAAAALRHAIMARHKADDADTRPMRMAAEAARRLPHARVSEVAIGLGLSERHLRRLFRQVVGVSPKTFARLERFRRAIRAARGHRDANWASIAVDAGYYDQAHLIDEFHAIAGKAPRAFIDELARSDAD